MGVEKRVFLSEDASEALWKIIFSQENNRALQRLDDLAKLTVKKDALREEAAEHDEVVGAQSYSSTSEVTATPTV